MQFTVCRGNFKLMRFRIVKTTRVSSGVGYRITGYLESTSENEQKIIQIGINALRDFPVDYCDASSDGKSIILFQDVDVIVLKQALDQLERGIATSIKIEPLLGLTKKQREINDLLCKNQAR